jgi:hypothetical protein
VYNHDQGQCDFGKRRGSLGGSSYDHVLAAVNLLFMQVTRAISDTLTKEEPRRNNLIGTGQTHSKRVDIHLAKVADARVAIHAV